MLTVLPIRYVADVDASRRFYAGLGLTVEPGPALTVWAQLDADAGAVGIHDAAASQGRPPGTVELGFATEEDLDTVSRRLTAAGYDHHIVEENFGRSIRVTDPDGVVVQIQNIDLAVAEQSEAAMKQHG